MMKKLSFSDGVCLVAGQSEETPKMVSIDLAAKKVSEITLQDTPTLSSQFNILLVGSKFILYHTHSSFFLFHKETLKWKSVEVEEGLTLIEETQLENAIVFRKKASPFNEFVIFILKEINEEVNLEKFVIGNSEEENNISTSFQGNKFAVISRKKDHANFVSTIFSVEGTSLIKHKTISLPYEININERGSFLKVFTFSFLASSIN